MKDMKMKKPNMPAFASRSTMGPGSMGPGGASRSTMGPGAMSRPGMAMPAFASRAMRPGGMAKGGKIHEDAAMDKKLIRKEISRAEKMEEKSEKKEMKKGGKVMPAKDPVGKDLMAIKDTPVGRRMASAAMGAKKMAKGGGIESKGKTKGRFV